MDRDYLTIPADQIKDIKPVITMVAGKMAYDAAAQSGAAQSGATQSGASR